MGADEFREPPQIDPEKLDFSMWHPLDHRPFSQRCREHYGGGRHHLKIAWEFRWSSEMRRFTLCKIGVHRRGQWTKMKDRKPHYTYVACVHCGKRFSNNQPV